MIVICYDEDLKKVEKIIYNNLAKIKEQIPTIKEVPYYKGVQSLADLGVVIRIYARVDEIDRIQANRDLNRAMKILFDDHHIEIPFPQIVVNYPKDTPQK